MTFTAYDKATKRIRTVQQIHWKDGEIEKIFVQDEGDMGSWLPAGAFILEQNYTAIVDFIGEHGNFKSVDEAYKFIKAAGGGDILVIPKTNEILN